jgi:hypothetical protein|eukprot:COSAG01_NODE_7539_length_3159_cov_2.557190_2_plen_34_part_00
MCQELWGAGAPLWRLLEGKAEVGLKVTTGTHNI